MRRLLTTTATLFGILLVAGCDSTEPPPPTGSIEGRVSVCAAGTELCFTAERNVDITASGPTPKTDEALNGFSLTNRAY